ncbi:hypothetical protein K1T71_006030 [Dendrolimus kikuchii]|uniref:Uncharacterized protein n=1 Tax=Dendrolimus kikuchii TaxID=765133 RepID=A0ACC1D483_9NEOP|nr:hypothetical protein K1T71_006030 [Dendrolimus kikuchii]
MASITGKMNFNTKHLKKGDPLPPFNGKLRVYNMRFCPYAQRTILALIAKKIDCEVINVDLVEKPEWLTSKSPFGKVPALEMADGQTICESLVTVEYLDQVFPQRPLLPQDPYKQAIDKVIVQSTGPIESMFIKQLKFPDRITEDNYTAYHNALEFVQEQLKSRGTKFIDGNEPGYADYMIWPFFERLRMFDNNPRMRLDENKYPLLVEYLRNMLNDPVVSEYIIPLDILAKFLSAYTEGTKPQYDILIED